MMKLKKILEVRCFIKFILILERFYEEQQKNRRKNTSSDDDEEVEKEGSDTD